MEYGTVRKWIGLTSSFLCTILSGLFLSFNVYAVQLKQRLDLSQTQVELLASFTIAGLSVAFIGYFIIKKCGYRACYVVAWIMVTSSGVLMWLATLYTHFFREWIAFLCLFQFMSTVGGCLAEQCCVAIAITLFSKRHIGKVTGIYLAAVGFGKIYYGAIYQLVFKTEEHLGEFFLSIPMSFTIAVVPCMLFHRPPEGVEEGDDERASLKKKDTIEEDCEKTHKSELKKSARDDTTNDSLKPMLKSGCFHLFLWANALFTGCSTSFMNNITGMGHDIGMVQTEVTVYAISVGIIVSRIAVGAIYDYFGTQAVGYWLLTTCYLTFIGAVVIGWAWLNEITIFIMIGMASMGVGAAFSLGLAILVSEYGVQHYSLLIGLLEIEITLSTFFLQVFIGLTHDHFSGQNPTDERCVYCFHWAFVILFSGSVIALICLLIKIFAPRCIRNQIK